MKKMKLLSEYGFTLIEMLTVVFIISILLLLVVPNMSGVSESVTEDTDGAFQSTLQAQVDLYYLENKSYPETIGDLNLSATQLEEAAKYDISSGVVTKKVE